MSDLATIERLEEELRAAMLAGDADRLDGLLADDLLFTNHEGARLTKADDLAAHRSGLLRLERIEPLDRSIRLLDGAAIAAVRVALAGSFDGSPFEGTFAYTRVWRRQGDRWVIAAAHSSAVPPR